MRCRIVIADDHALVVDAFRNLLEPEFDVVGSAGDGVELLTLTEKLRPDVVLIDIGLPVLNGFEAGKEVKRLFPQTKLIVVTFHEDIALAAQVMRLWASGYLLKTSEVTELNKAVREVMQGKHYVSASLARRLNEDFIRDPRLDRFRELTPRQREVVQCLAEGRTMVETADRLQITPRTVAFHKYQIMQEFGLRNNSELVRFAIGERISRMELSPPHQASEHGG